MQRPRTTALLLTLLTLPALAQPERPQTPTPPFDYPTHEVTLPSLDEGVTLAGTLCLPDPDTFGPGPYPAVIFHSGSGPQDRDETIHGHKPFAVLADALATRGIASLRCDDRGVGGSTTPDNTSTNQATLEQLADDAAGLLRFLRADTRIDPKRTGYIGHSEGGNIAAILMDRDQLPGPAVLIAGPTVRGEPLLLEQLLKGLELAGLQGERLKAAREPFAEWIATMAAEPDTEAYLTAGMRVLNAQAGAEVPEAQARAILTQIQPEFFNTHMRSFLNHDPGPGLAKAKAPVLALFGGLDAQVIAEQNAPVTRTLLRQHWPADSEVIIIESGNHLFQHAKTGAEPEYAAIEETISPLIVELITDWLAARFELPSH